MSTTRFFEDDSLVETSLYVKQLPEEILKYPICEEKFLVKVDGKFEKLRVVLYHAVLGIYGIDGVPKFILLSFVRSNYQVEESHSQKYRIDLMKFSNTQSLYTDALPTVKKWMEHLSKYCINSNFYTKYKVKEQIGQGAFGKVFKVALESDASIEYAAKIFDKKQMKKDDKRFLISEIKILQIMEHQSIMGIIEVHETVDEVAVVLELLRHGQLSQFMANNQKISQTIIREIMRQIFRGLEYMASLKIVHRDLKPSNILIERYDKFEGEKLPILKIADVGVACFEDQKDEFEFAGTYGFVAPENFQLLNKELASSVRLTSKMDVYSAGVIFYMLITKRNPFKLSDDYPVAKANEAGKVTFDSMYITRFSKVGISLLKLMLEAKPKSRISAKEALAHEFFKEVEPKSNHSTSPDKMKHSDSNKELKPPSQNQPGMTAASSYRHMYLKKLRSKSAFDS